MPSIYAHDKFGDMVLEKMPKEERKIVRQYYQSFQIVLQGPDYLFFYKERKEDKYRRKGYKLHRQDAYEFMENAVEVVRMHGKESREYSYALGFILHFVLDSECHPYIGEAEKETGCSHAEIECDFDYLTLIRDQQIPNRFKLAKLVPTSLAVAESVEPFFDEDMTVIKVQSALKRMRRTKALYYIPRPLKRALVQFVLKRQNRPNRIFQQAILPDRNEKCKKQTDHLYELMEQSVPKALYLIDNFSSALDGGVLDEGFHKDFLGRKVEPEIEIDF